MAEDNFIALEHFFEKFPEYVNNSFYITGESYGGIYVPTLSSRVMDDSDFNFKVLMRLNKCWLCYSSIVENKRIEIFY